ncbi:MAG: DUF4320 family protein [Eubacteriales bacterium]|nr:DUF4320 family protein [Eubacteriales bacterium]
MINIIKSKRGEGYIDVVVSVLVSMMLLVLILNVFSFLTIKQDMDYFSKEMIESACMDGQTSGKVDERYDELVDEIDIFPAYSWQSTYYNISDHTVQLGDTITIITTYRTYVKGFGVIRIPITLTTTYSGLSQQYWK